MIDCHVIDSADTPRAWVTQCLDSVYAAAERAAFAVHVHVVAGMPGHIGRARASGYAIGHQPYVTCVDDDDYLLPQAFMELTEALARLPAAIFPAEMTLQNGHLRPGLQRHHLAIYRRDVLIDHAAWLCCGDVAQMKAVASNDVIDIPTPVTVHRLYADSKARALRRAHHDELERARG